MLEIAQSSEQTTIIVTTHYIEEARQADRVSVMVAATDFLSCGNLKLFSSGGTDSQTVYV